VPESDIDEFARVVEARVSDPDVEIPFASIDSETEVRPSPTDTDSGPKPPEAPPSKDGWAVDELDHLMREIDSVQGRTSASDLASKDAAPWVRYSHPVPLHSRLPHRWHASVSGGRSAPSGIEPGLPRYVRVLRELVQEGSWIGSLGEIARRTGDDTDHAFANLLKFHADLVGKDLVVAPVEVERGWQWLVVDRSRIRPATSDSRPPT
jgi:hypothetical protein